MQELLDTLLDQARGYSVFETVAVAAALLYLLLAIRQNIWCWACACISTSIYVYLAFDARLYMQSLLNVFYFAMAIYGWHVWLHGRNRHDGRELPVVSWPLTVHGRALLFIAAAGVISGFLLRAYTDARFPFVDSMSAWAAIWATFLVARKVLENWWYWLVIDVASALIYWSRDLQLTALLFVIYVIMIPFGYMSWSRSRQQSRV